MDNFPDFGASAPIVTGGIVCFFGLDTMRRPVASFFHQPHTMCLMNHQDETPPARRSYGELNLTGGDCPHYQAYLRERRRRELHDVVLFVVLFVAGCLALGLIGGAQ